jgi:hypothetical protein
MRVDRQTVDVAARFDPSLASRLSDGTVSERDVLAARTICDNLAKYPPVPRNTRFSDRHDRADLRRWNEQVQSAQSLYQTVEETLRSQSPRTTRRENAKDSGRPLRAAAPKRNVLESLVGAAIHAIARSVVSHPQNRHPPERHQGWVRGGH